MPGRSETFAMKTQCYCYYCDKFVLGFQKSSPFGGEYWWVWAIISIFLTCGAAIFLWLFVMLMRSGEDKSYYCPNCGSFADVFGPRPEFMQYQTVDESELIEL
jgi:hypothetical protein